MNVFSPPVYDSRIPVALLANVYVVDYGVIGKVGWGVFFFLLFLLALLYVLGDYKTYHTVDLTTPLSPL